MSDAAITDDAPANLLSLPDELLRTVFEHVTALDLARLQQACRRFHTLGADALLWQDNCLHSFRWWDKHHELDLKRLEPSLWTYSTWKELFSNRWISNRNAQRALSDLMNEETNRLDRIKEIVDLGYDAKDVLLERWETAEQSEMFLAQR